MNGDYSDLTGFSSLNKKEDFIIGIFSKMGFVIVSSYCSLLNALKMYRFCSIVIFFLILKIVSFIDNLVSFRSEHLQYFYLNTNRLTFSQYVNYDTIE